MSALPVFKLTSKDADRASLFIQAQQERRNAWPYTDRYAPPNADRVFEWGVIAAPASAAAAQVCIYTVPQGARAVITSVVFQTVVPAGSGMFVSGSGDVLWTLDVNTPVGVDPIQGSVVKGFFQVPFDLGTTQAPWSLSKPEVGKPQDVFRVKVESNPLVITPGAPQFYIAIINGWEWPVTE